jgi:AbrB family looped-hinge helix DNA binding protein
MVGVIMIAVKILPKGQITLPKSIRKSLNIGDGDTMILEKKGETIVLRKGETIFDYVGALPSKGMSVDDIRDIAVREAMKDHA